MGQQPAIGFSIIMRVEMPNEPGAFGTVASLIGEAGGVVGAVDVRSVTRQSTVRDFTVQVASQNVADAVRAAVSRHPGVTVVSVSDSTFLAHLGGKIRIEPKIPVKTRQDLSIVYTPGGRR
jgi:malate dehydrogenase (oxaloacetate-decarboxylating)